MEYLDFAIDVARAAGDVLKHYMDREKLVALKGRANLVTIADIESEVLIIRRTLERYQAQAICGAVYDTWRDEMFTGARGLGSFMNGQRLRVSDIDKLGSGLILTGC